METEMEFVYSNENMKGPQVEYKKNSKDVIKFSCAKCGMCCCDSPVVPLTPLDIWWMRKHFQCTTDFLFEMNYAKVVIEENTMLPRAVLNIREATTESGAKYGVCPFVEAMYVADDIGRNDPCPCGSGKKLKKCCEDKKNKILCSMWSDRPAPCRLYPLLYYIYWNNETCEYTASFHMSKDTFCKGRNNYSADISIENWIKQDDKLNYAMEYGVKFAYMLKDIREKSYADGEIKHDHINILANILYNFDSYLKPEELMHVIFDRDAMGVVANLVLNFLADPSQFGSTEEISQNKIIIPR